MGTFTDYMTIASNLSRYQTMTADDPTVAQATKYFQANIGSITTPAQLVNNTRIFNYVMNAFGLGDMTYAKSLIQKVLEQGTTSSTALANTLNNPNILALAQAFNFPALRREHHQDACGDNRRRQSICHADAGNQRRPAEPRGSARALFSAERLQDHQRLFDSRRSRTF